MKLILFNSVCLSTKFIALRIFVSTAKLLLE